MSALLRATGGRRVGIVLLTGIGDVIHGLPIATDLKRQDPGRTVLWVAEAAPARILEHHPAVDEIVVFRRQRGLQGVIELAGALRGRRCDVTLNMQRYMKSVFPTMLSGARVRVGLPPSKTRDAVALFHTHHLAERPWCHTQDLLLGYREALGAAGGCTGGVAHHVLRWGACRTGPFLRCAGTTPVAGVVLATANPKKDWPAERYPRLVEALTRELGYRVLLIGGPGSRERAVAQLILAASGSTAVSGLGNSVRRMMWMVDGVDLLVCPDTGPLHVAHALATPVVGLFGHSNPARVGPWRRYRDLVIDRYTEQGATPDPSVYEPKRGRMEKIEVQDILKMVERARSRYGVRKRERR